jgi:hypothetical protein
MSKTVIAKNGIEPLKRAIARTQTGRHPCRGCRASWGVDAGEEVRFALDSPLEGGGFEPSVPGAKEPVSFAEGELRGIERGRPTKFVSLRGTDGSNPSPSSGESNELRSHYGKLYPGTILSWVDLGRVRAALCLIFARRESMPQALSAGLGSSTRRDAIAPRRRLADSGRTSPQVVSPEDFERLPRAFRSLVARNAVDWSHWRRLTSITA